MAGVIQTTQYVDFRKHGLSYRREAKRILGTMMEGFSRTAALLQAKRARDRRVGANISKRKELVSSCSSALKTLTGSHFDLGFHPQPNYPLMGRENKGTFYQDLKMDCKITTRFNYSFP